MRVNVDKQVRLKFILNGSEDFFRRQGFWGNRRGERILNDCGTHTYYRSLPQMKSYSVERPRDGCGFGSGLRGSISSRMAVLYTNEAMMAEACIRSPGWMRSYTSMLE